MKELGNLAVVCSARMDILLQIYDGYASVYLGEGPARTYLVAKCNDDKAIKNIIHELNFGKYALERKMQNGEKQRAA